MQNMGFAMSVIPVLKSLNLGARESENFLTTHLQMFNTHPYFSAPIIGTIVRLEEEKSSDGTLDAVSIKQSLMASYAAIGDIFFWGAFRPLMAIASVILMYMGVVVAPVLFLLIYNVVHLWVRLKGFVEGYSKGKRGFEFIRSLNLPGIAGKVRWISLMILIVILLWLSRDGGYWPFIKTHGLFMKIAAISAVMFCLLILKKGFSQIYMIYAAFLIFITISWMGLLT
mgnify:CR=1 FL=1